MERHRKEWKPAIFAMDFPEPFHTQTKVFENLIKPQRNIQ